MQVDWIGLFHALVSRLEKGKDRKQSCSVTTREEDWSWNYVSQSLYVSFGFIRAVVLLRPL